MTANSVQYGQVPFQYINGFQISNDLVSPNTLLDIGVGSTLDSTGTFQIVTQNPIVINTAVTGANGLDTGVIARNTVYCIYLIWNPATSIEPAAVLSLSYEFPLMPIEYSAYRLIGYVPTDNSAHILAGVWIGTGSSRQFNYMPGNNVLEFGTADTQTNINLNGSVPIVNNTKVDLMIFFRSSVVNDLCLIGPTYLTISPANYIINLRANVASVNFNQYCSGIPTSLTEISGQMVPALAYQLTNSATDVLSLVLSAFYYDLV